MIELNQAKGGRKVLLSPAEVVAVKGASRGRGSLVYTTSGVFHVSQAPWVVERLIEEATGAGESGGE